MAAAGGAGASAEELLAAVASAGPHALDQAAIPFVTVDDEDKFEIHAEAVKYLKTLTGQIAVVSIAGIYRTGKSYLLNQLMGRPNGFTVGPTVKACTKGIWLWGKGIEVEGSSLTVLFLDTEGLGSTIRSESYDCRIFALAILLSSYFIYNSFGTIDGTAVQKLSLVVNLTKHIHVRSQASKEDSGTEFNQFFPHFMWVVRDFSVKLEKDGRKISAREYLEEALRPEDGMSEAAEQKNAVRMLIRNFFPERDCLTMVRPVSDEKQLSNLASLPNDVLRPEFRAQIEVLKKRVLGNVRPKTLYGKPLNGSMLGNLAAAYVAALNTGSTPTISTAWDRVVDSQCSDAVEAGAALYSKTMREALVAAEKRAVEAAAAATAALSLQVRGASSTYTAESTIVEANDLFAAHSEASLAAMEHFRHAAVQDPEKTPPYEQRLRQSVESEYRKLRDANEAASMAFCLALLDKLHGEASNSLKQQLTAAAGKKGGAAAAGAGKEKEKEKEKEKKTEERRSSTTGTDGSAAAAAVAAADTRIAAAEDSLLPAASVSTAYRTVTLRLNDLYLAAARGPAKQAVLLEYLLTKLPLLLADATLGVDESYSHLVSAFKAGSMSLRELNSSAVARQRAAEEKLASEKQAFQAALAESARSNADRVEQQSTLLEQAKGEIGRLQAQYDKLLSVHEVANVRAEEASARHDAALAASSKRVDELLSTRTTFLFDMTSLSQRLVEAEAAKADADKLVAELRNKLLEESKAAAVLAERCRAAENETVRLREQTELLYESLRVQKDLLVTKNDEKEESEYQWGVAKAKLAQTESDRVSLQSDINILSSLATQLKGQLLKQGKNALKGLNLDRLEQRAFDALGE